MPASRLLMLLACASVGVAQPVAPPKVLLLVRQQFKSGRERGRERLERASAAAYNRLQVPVYWMELQAFTGPPEALFFDSFDSFEAVEEAAAVLAPLNGAHPDLARIQAGIDDTLSSQRTILGVRRDSLGSGAIDLSQARFIRMLVVRTHEGEEPPSAAALTPSVVYEVTSGMPGSAFLVFQILPAFDGNPVPQVTHGSVVEDSVYVVEPEMSHVSQAFAQHNQPFWTKPPGQ